MAHVYDPNFKYTPSGKTDIRKTFARIKREQAAKEAADKAAQQLPKNVKQWRQA